MAPGTEVSFEVGGSLLKGWNLRKVVQGNLASRKERFPRRNPTARGARFSSATTARP